MARRLATEFVSIQLKLKGGAVPSFVAKLRELAPSAQYHLLKNGEGEVGVHDRSYVCYFHIVKQAENQAITEEMVHVCGRARVYHTRAAHNFLKLLQAFSADFVEKRMYPGFRIINTFKSGELWKIEEERYDEAEHLIYERKKANGEASVTLPGQSYLQKESVQHVPYGINNKQSTFFCGTPSALERVVEEAFDMWRRRRIDELLDLRHALMTKKSSKSIVSLPESPHSVVTSARSTHTIGIAEIDTMLRLLTRTSNH